MLGNLGDDRGCREGGGPDGPRALYGECKIKDGERGAGCGERGAGRIWSAVRTNLMKSASPTCFGSHLRERTDLGLGISDFGEVALLRQR